jgi:hypothetical protein
MDRVDWRIAPGFQGKLKSSGFGTHSRQSSRLPYWIVRTLVRRSARKRARQPTMPVLSSRARRKAALASAIDWMSQHIDGLLDFGRAAGAGMHTTIVCKPKGNWR